MEASEYATLAALEDRHWWYVGMRALAQTAVGALELPPDPRILDVGCGTGGNLRWLAGIGRATGVDVAPLALTHAVRRAGPVVARADALSLPFAPGAFDLVTSFEVLYHAAVPDDDAGLREMSRVLAPDGLLLLRLPAHNWLRGAHDRQVHTARRYGLAELRDKIQRAGLIVRHLAPVGLWLLPLAVLQRGWQSRRKAAPASDVRLPPQPINSLLAALLAAEGRLAARHRLPWGLSLFAVAQKS